MGGMTSDHSVGRWIVSRLGGNPAGALGIDLRSDAGLRRWLVACCVGQRHAAAVLVAADREGVELSTVAPETLARLLEDAGHRQPERVARLVGRALQALDEGHAGSPNTLAAVSDDFNDLGSRLSALAPGLGPATVVRFLGPLRDTWPAARELPLAPAAHAAAVCLGLLAAGDDLDGEPGALRAALADDPEAPPLADVAAALGRLGAQACLRRPARCPLREECPRGAREAPS